MLRRSRSTPAQLRLAVALAVVASLGFAVVGWRALLAKSEALDRARAENAVHTRLQSVRTGLVVADAAAGVDVLLGPEQTRMTPNDVRWAMVPVAVGMVAAARAAADVPTLAAADLRLTEYTAQVGTARELARLERPQTPERLDAASRLLRAEVLPRLAAAQDAGAARLRADVDASAHGTAFALAAGVIAVLVLLAVQVWLSRRFRRLLNPGLAAGLALLTALTIAAVAVSARSDRRADEVRAGPYLVAQQVVDARMAAFEARSLESSGVVGDGVAALEPTWRAAFERASTSLDLAAAAASGPTAPDVASAVTKAQEFLTVYAGVHARLLAADRAGRRQTVREIAVSPTLEGAPGSFEDVDTTTAALLARQSQAVDDGWIAAGGWLALTAWGCLLAGGLAAATAATGLAPRLREYR